MLPAIELGLDLMKVETRHDKQPLVGDSGDYYHYTGKDWSRSLSAADTGTETGRGAKRCMVIEGMNDHRQFVRACTNSLEQLIWEPRWMITFKASARMPTFFRIGAGAINIGVYIYKSHVLHESSDVTHQDGVSFPIPDIHEYWGADNQA